MRIDWRDAGTLWMGAGIVLMLGALVVAGVAYAMHLVSLVPWWLIMIMCGLMLASVWCFAMANEAWDDQADRDALAREQAAFHAAEPYTGPERRRRTRNPVAPHLRIVEQNRAEPPKRFDDYA